MKHLFKYILTVTAALSFTLLAQAQTYKNDNGVSTAKTVTGPNSDGTYTITLETFATGTSTPTKSSTPVDVVLVLDVSGSMEEPKGEFTRLPNNTAISYNTVANGSITYFYNDNGYNKIYPEIRNNQYYLYYDYGYGKQYIGNASSTANGTIVTTSNNRRICTAKESRMDALKPAVKQFIQNISYNASHYKDSTDRPTGEHLNNRISIITFSAQNSSQTLCTLTKVEGNESTLEGYIDALKSGGGTYAGEGMNRANTVLSNANANANKVVVMFTDGEPSDNYGAIGNSDSGGTNAYRAKHTYEASVFTIGLFTDAPERGTDTWNYLNYVSSNYPNATVTTQWGQTRMNAGEGGDPSKGFYKDASGNVDLTAIFNDISGSIGGSDQEIGTSTEIRDVVTSSFYVPSGSEAYTPTFKIYKISEDGNSWIEDTAYPKTGITLEPGKKTYTENGKTIQRDTIGLTGFDFSKDDTKEGQGDGNWVGIRYNSSTQPPTPFYAGRKIVIEFRIREEGEATGGVGSATNTSESGVYVKKEDGTYENVNAYEIPHTTLPVNIKITKTGLRHAESATFQIFKIGPKIDTLQSVITGQRDSIVWRYNALGKPMPAEHEFRNPDGDLDPDNPHDYLEGTGWEKWSKVILTNKGADKVAVTKTLVSLDPNWVYLVIEDDWSWSYITTGSGAYQTTATVEVNPFTFTNTEKTNVPKHAEAVTINHFGFTISGGEFDGKQEEHYKSSKTKL